jgi:two-component sensor histidine kinase
MVVHELCTNALKYGALSEPAGFVEITWQTQPAETEGTLLIFEWSEHDGPVVVEPQTGGFGSRLVKRGLGSPDSRTTLEYRASGLYCRIEGKV